MRRVETGDPRRLEYRSGGGMRLPMGFLLVAMAVGIGILGIREEAPPLILGAVLFLGCGLFIALGRSALEVDLDARSYRSWWGLPFPIVVRDGALAGDAKVSLSREIRRRKNHTYTVFPVRLETGRRFTFTTPRSYEKARREAETLAKAIQLPLVDRGLGEEVVRAPDRLDESIRDRAAREGGLVDPGDPPAGILSTIETQGRTIRIHMPPRGFSPKLLLVLAPVAIFDLVFIVFLLSLVREADGPPRWIILSTAVALIVLPLVVMTAFLLRVARSACTIEASPEVLRVSFGSGGRGKVVEIPSRSLEDLDIARVGDVPGRRPLAGVTGFPIVARSDDARVAFGEYLPEEEKTWILRVLKQVLTA
jgi:hypothetical protein